MVLKSLKDNQRLLTERVSLIVMVLILTGMPVAVDAAVDSSGLEEPGSAQAYFERGVRFEQAGNYAAAEADFNQVIKIDPRHPNVYNHRGIVRFKLGMVQESIADYTISIQINPNDMHALNNRALCYYVERNWIALLNDFGSKKVLLPPGTPIDYDMLFVYLAQCHMDERDMGKDILQEYLANRESDGLDDWYLEVANYLLGKTTADNLVGAAGQAFGEQKKNRLCEAHFYIAANHELTGDYTTAYEHYRKCVDTGVVDFGEYQIARLELGALLLGVHFRSLSAGARQFLPIEGNAGLTVSDVTANGPAAAAGLQNTDIVVSINGQPATFVYLSEFWMTVNMGDNVTLGVLRKGQSIDVEVTLGKWQK